MDLLRTFHAGRGTTIVLVTHEAELAAMADARLVLRDGRVVERTGVVGADPRVPPSQSYGEARQSAKRDGGGPFADTQVPPHEAS
jgi:ABC-type methionine transport system ATPase subunit